MLSQNLIPTTVDEERSFALAYTDSTPHRHALRTDDILRVNFLDDMGPLARRGLIHPDAFKTCKGYTGYKNVATELQVLVSVARDNWSRIDGKCGITREGLDRADKIAAHMLRLVGLREVLDDGLLVTVDPPRKR